MSVDHQKIIKKVRNRMPVFKFVPSAKCRELFSEVSSAAITSDGKQSLQEFLHDIFGPAAAKRHLPRNVLFELDKGPQELHGMYPHRRAEEGVTLHLLGSLEQM